MRRASLLQLLLLISKALCINICVVKGKLNSLWKGDVILNTR